MTYHWIKQNGAAELLIFFAGWGMDPTPFQFLEAGDRDVLMCYDYTEPELPLGHHALFADYAQVDLAAWSLGVPVANAAFHGEGTRFRSAVAINGSASPIHDDYGIPPAIFNGTLDTLDAAGLQRFRRRVCQSRSNLERFDRTLPRRDLASLTAELVALRDRFTGLVADDCIFSRALVGKRDMIFPAQNQLRAWAALHVATTTSQAPHFPFYAWSAWRDLVCP
jgi:biotin synthesis protein BioG